MAWRDGLLSRERAIKTCRVHILVPSLPPRPRPAQTPHRVDSPGRHPTRYNTTSNPSQYLYDQHLSHCTHRDHERPATPDRPRQGGRGPVLPAPAAWPSAWLRPPGPSAASQRSTHEHCSADQHCPADTRRTADKHNIPSRPKDPCATHPRDIGHLQPPADHGPAPRPAQAHKRHAPPRL